jgi:hypothetical protein
MMSSNGLFVNIKKKYEQTINALSKYLQLGVKLIQRGDLQQTEVFPICFRPLEPWINTFPSSRSTYIAEINLPLKNFKRSMDGEGRVFANTIDLETLPIFLQFSLKNLRTNKKSAVQQWSLLEDENYRNFRNISEDCSLL